MKTGKRLWRRKLAGDIWPEAPAIVGRFAYIRTWGTLASVSRADGTPRWELDTLTRWQEHNSAAVAREIIYIGSADFGLRAYATSSGAELWASYTGQVRSFTVTPAVTNGLVFAGSWDHRLYAFDARTARPFGAA